MLLKAFITQSNTFQRNSFVVEDMYLMTVAETYKWNNFMILAHRGVLICDDGFDW